MGITQPRRGEVARWMIYIMCLAIVALSGALVGMYYDNKAERKAMEEIHAIDKAFFRSEIKRFQSEANAAEAAFSDFLKEQNERMERQQREIKRLKK